MSKRQVEVLLTQNILKLGNMGDIVRVRAGYARNFLIPGGKAIQANEAAKRQIEILRERAAAQTAEAKAKAEEFAKTIEGKSVTIAANVSHDKQLFGSIGNRDIVDAFAQQGIELKNEYIAIAGNIKEVGSHKVELQLFKGVTCNVSVHVVDKNPAAHLDEVLSDKKEEETEEANA